MHSPDVDKIFELFTQGLFSGCLAFTTFEPLSQKALKLLLDKSRQKFKSVRQITLDKTSDNELQYDESEFVIVTGFELIETQSTLAYKIRTILDARRYENLYSLLIMEESTFRKMFTKRDDPFYLFCDQLPVNKVASLAE
jgi:hypothetical protein